MNIADLYLYQIVVVVVSLFMIYQGFSKFLKKEGGQTFVKFFIRLVVWGGMIFIVLFPSFSYKLANTIGITGNINAVILTGFILIFLMIFKLLSAIEKLEQQISELTREEALGDLKKK